MASQELWELTIDQVGKLIASRQVSPVEVVEAHLERIEETEEALNSFITVMADQAQEAARRAQEEIEAGRYLGPLHGVPVGLKDLYYTEGVRTTMGSRIYRDFVPDYDAAVVERFRRAGAVILGKLQLHEFALGATSENPHDGPAHNPWDRRRVTGGSSGGSGSSVAAGQCMAALGSDTGGSVRIPASLCGIVGLKPTFGRISRWGVYPLAWSLDTVGPMTRTVRDCALVLNAIAGYDPRDPSSVNRPVEDYTLSLERGARGLRMAVPREYFFDVLDPEVEGAFRRAVALLEEMGAVVEEVSVPALEHSFSISSAILLAEAAEVHRDHLRHLADEIGQDVRARLELGALLPAADYLRAQRARAVFNRQMAEAMRERDVLLTPTTPITAPEIGQATVTVRGRQESALQLLPRLTRPFNICGYPTLSLPCGFDSRGLPIGLQMTARPWQEATLLRAAHAYEQATEWHRRRPPL